MSLFSWLNLQLINNLNHTGIRLIASHFIVSNHVASQGNVVDFGANVGSFYCTIQHQYNATCYVVEAAPSLFKKLPASLNVHLFHLAIAGSDGLVNFYLSDEPEANSILYSISANWGIRQQSTIRAVTAETFFKLAAISGLIEVLKVDIEGAELDMLENISASNLSRVKQIPIEFHDFLTKEADYSARMGATLTKLRKNNFLIVKISSHDHREVLCINKKLINLTTTQLFRLKFVHPLIRTLKSMHSMLGALRHW